jgi:hypothetical protein
MTARERAMVARRLRATRLPRLAALRDILGTAALAALALVYGYRSWPPLPADVSVLEVQALSPAIVFAVVPSTALGLTAALLLRQAWPRLSALRSEAGRLRRDARQGIAEETVHRTVRALLLEAPGGWVAALLEDDSGKTRFIEAVPRGHAPADLLASFPPAVLRLEKALHSGIELMETREGQFDGDPDTIVLGQRPSNLPEHGAVLEITLDQVGDGAREVRYA